MVCSPGFARCDLVLGYVIGAACACDLGCWVRDHDGGGGGKGAGGRGEEKEGDMKMKGGLGDWVGGWMRCGEVREGGLL